MWHFARGGHGYKWLMVLTSSRTAHILKFNYWYLGMVEKIYNQQLLLFQPDNTYIDKIHIEEAAPKSPQRRKSCISWFYFRSLLNIFYTPEKRYQGIDMLI